MRRATSVALLVVAVLALLASRQLLEEDQGGEPACDAVRAVFERVSFIEESGEVPTSRVYGDAALAAEQAALAAPPDVAAELDRIATAYTALRTIYVGFDPDDPATYAAIEEQTPELEAAEAAVDEALPGVESWLDARCG